MTTELLKCITASFISILEHFKNIPPLGVLRAKIDRVSCFPVYPKQPKGCYAATAHFVCPSRPLQS